MTPGGAQGLFTLLQHGVGAAVMHVIGGKHGDSAMAVLGVVPEKNDRQKAMAAWISSNRLGKPGWYFRVLNWASEKGLSSLTWGRLSERVTPRSASSCAVAFAGHGRPAVGVQGEHLGLDACLRQVCSISVAARAAFSRSATIQPTT